MRRFEVPDGWVVQAFDFALDLTSDQSGVLARQFGGRRVAYNWAVRALKVDIEVSCNHKQLSGNGSVP